MGRMRGRGSLSLPPSAAVVLVTCAEVHTWTLSPRRSRCCPQLLCISSPRQEGKANTVAQSPLLLAPFPTGEP